MNANDIDQCRHKAHSLSPFDGRRIAALSYLADVERMYREAHGLLDKARRELARASYASDEGDVPVGAMMTATAEDRQGEIVIGGE